VPRHPGRNPLFQAWFNDQSADAGAWPAVRPSRPPALFDVGLYVYREGERLRLDVTVAADLFDQPVAEGLAGGLPRAPDGRPAPAAPRPAGGRPRRGTWGGRGGGAVSGPWPAAAPGSATGAGRSRPASGPAWWTPRRSRPAWRPGGPWRWPRPSWPRGSGARR